VLNLMSRIASTLEPLARTCGKPSGSIVHCEADPTGVVNCRSHLLSVRAARSMSVKLCKAPHRRSRQRDYRLLLLGVLLVLGTLGLITTGLGREIGQTAARLVSTIVARATPAPENQIPNGLGSN
jgi:hypothetical protein